MITFPTVGGVTAILTETIVVVIMQNSRYAILSMMAKNL